MVTINSCQTLMKLIEVLAMAAALALGTSCSRGGGRSASDCDSLRHADDFHADNDIAMAVGSIIDALRVGESLDSTYNQKDVVLTDGIGRPLYASLDGTPGEWNLTATSDTSYVVANTSIGDLAVDDLKSYLLGATAEPGVTDYQLADNVEVRFNTRIDTTANGLTGPTLTLTLLRH